MVQSNVMPSQSPVNPSVSRLQDYFGLASRSEVWIAAGLLCLGTFFKFWNVFLFRFNSDEPQHLHVVWAWTHGLVQYRDVFDNHMPLFQLLCAPILGLLGEHAADLYWMRLLMVPLYFLSLWCVYRIGTIAFSRRVGLCATPRSHVAAISRWGRVLRGMPGRGAASDHGLLRGEGRVVTVSVLRFCAQSGAGDHENLFELALVSGGSAHPDLCHSKIYQEGDQPDCRVPSGFCLPHLRDVFFTTERHLAASYPGRLSTALSSGRSGLRGTAVQDI